jgi:hypothetical protein
MCGRVKWRIEAIWKGHRLLGLPIHRHIRVLSLARRTHMRLGGIKVDFCRLDANQVFIGVFKLSRILVGFSMEYNASTYM